MSLLLWTAGAVFSALVGLLITVLFQDRVSVALLKVLRGFRVDRNNRNLSGKWYSYFYIAPESGQSRTAAAMNRILTIRLRQVGTRVAGTGTENSRNYFALATFREPYLTGTWRNSIDGRNSWGAFQLLCHDNGRWMAGKFVGKDSGGHINHGLWLWAQTADELYQVVEWAAERKYVSNATKFRTRLNAVLGRPAGEA